MSTKLQSDLMRMRDRYSEDSDEKRTIHNALIALKCGEDYRVEHEQRAEAMNEIIVSDAKLDDVAELMHEIYEEQDDLVIEPLNKD